MNEMKLHRLEIVKQWNIFAFCVLHFFKQPEIRFAYTLVARAYAEFMLEAYIKIRLIKIQTISSAVIDSVITCVIFLHTPCVSLIFMSEKIK